MDPSSAKFEYNAEEHHYQSGLQAQELVSALAFPMTLTLQVTRRCNLRCIYCSEDAMIKEPSQDTLFQIIDRLKGVDRVIIAGGEPTLRKDLPEIANRLRQTVNIVAMASNVVLMTPELARRLHGSLAYVDVTIDGTRDVHNRIRGSYDEVLTGVRTLINEGLDVSLVTVLLSDNVESVIDVCRLANELHAKKLKILTPIRKGRGANVVSRRLASPEILSLYQRLKEAKAEEGWTHRISITDWGLVDEGHAILVHPNGDVVASPVPSEPSCVRLLGNVLRQDLAELWKSYPYRANHVNKYLEETLLVC